jgi:hypothetical protein
MHPRVRCVSLLCLCLAVPAFFGSVRAQTEKTITVRMIDTRTGILIASSNYLVRINHIREEHGDWIVKNEDGSGKLTLPPGAEEISVHATYESATMLYANCDADKDHGSSEKASRQEHWYPVATILTSGLVAPNGCVGKKVPEKDQVVAKPGEFVFFVRPLSPREQLLD